MADRSLLWHAPTHERTERSTDWFWALGIIAACGAILSVLFGNILLAVIIVLGALMLGLLASREPRDCEVELSPAGVRIDHSLYPYRSLKSFWVDEEEGRLPHLILSTTSLIDPQLAIPMLHSDAEQVRAYLRPRLSEVEQHESFFSRVGEALGF